MAFRATSSGIYAIDYSVSPPEIVLDSSEKLLHSTEAGPISNSITIPARTATAGGGINPGWHNQVNIDYYHPLSAINVNADVVLGGFSVTTIGGAQGMTGLGVFDAGGTYIHHMVGYRHSGTGVVTQDIITGMALYTFVANGGTLYLHERVVLDSGRSQNSRVTTSLTLFAIRFDYKLFVGTLT